MEQFKIKAGAGSCSIDFPEKMFPTDGFKGIHDSTYMGVVVIDAGVRVAFASIELVNIPDDAVEIAKKTISGINNVRYENIWVHATHTITSPHAPGGPGIPPKKTGEGQTPPPAMPPMNGKRPPMDPDAPMKRECFIETFTAAVEKCAKEAQESFSEARIGLGTGKCNVNVNRDIETPNGWWIGLGGNEISNKDMTIIRIEKNDGTPICFMMSYGIKPCAIDNSEMKEKTRLVSGDITGYACRMVSDKLGAPCMFFMSAAADQVPREQSWYEKTNDDGTVSTVDNGVESGLAIVSRLGTEMAENAIEIAENISCNMEETAVSRAYNTFTAEGRTGGGMPKKPAKEMNCVSDRKLEIDADVITMGDIAFVAVKPEVCCRTELNLKERSPYGTTLVMSMVNGGMKYMPDKLSYDRVTWEAQNNSLMPGTAEKWTDMVVDMLDNIKSEKVVPVVTAVAEPYPDGEKIVKAVIELKGNECEACDIKVIDRNIVSAEKEGDIVTLILDENDDAASVIPKMQHPQGPPKGEGPAGPGGQGGPGGPGGPDGKRRAMPERKRKPVEVQVMIPGIGRVVSTKSEEKVIDGFAQNKYKSFPYNLFVPELKQGMKYPLVVFIPDASPNGEDPMMALSQGIGATVWAEPENQKKHPCYVLAIQVPKSVHLTYDDSTVAPEFDQIKELIDKVAAENQVDMNRIYMTGQSQGGMSTFEMNLRYPDFLAASLCVSSQWDAEKVGKLSNNKFFMGLSTGDIKAYPGMTAICEQLAQNGAKVSRIDLDYREGWDAINAKVTAGEGDANVILCPFAKETVWMDDMENHGAMEHHNRGWELTYRMDAAREWIFAQKKEN